MNSLLISRLAAISLASAALASCGGTPPVGMASDVEVLQIEGLPAPDNPYAFAPLDKLTITVFGQEELSGVRQINSDGSLNFPLIGRIEATGMEPSLLEREIEDRLRGRYVLNPTVSIATNETPSRNLFVGGQVRRAGSFPADSNMTLTRAIIVAGGRNDFAKVDDVLITRISGGQKYIGIYNVEAIERGNYPDPVVYPDDVILVGDSKARREFLTGLSIVQALVQPLILIERAAF